MNQRFLLAALVLSGCTALPQSVVSQHSNSSAPSTPKLVVGITVDQMRADYLSRFGVWDAEVRPGSFGEGGFRRMIREGFACRDHHFGYAPTYTGPGHASIYTGTTPAVHGILSNDWYDRASASGFYCASDTSVQGVGMFGIDADGSALGTPGQMSPHRMLSTTLGDEMKMATGGQAKVIGVSMKDRGAILPAGHAADGAFWYYGKELGHFISSTYYGDALPDWVIELNRSGRSEALMQQGWDRLVDAALYDQCLPDNNAYEGAFKGELKPTFPYNLQELKAQNAGYDLLKATPGGNTLIVDFALAAIEGEGLGQDQVTDLLALSFSATDYVGHRVGPHAQETMDMYLRLDLELERLFDALDQKVGPGNWTVFLTADHGGANVPSHAASLGMPADYWRPGNLMDALEIKLAKHYGDPGEDTWILNSSNDQVMLNHPLLEARGIDRCDMARFVAEQCATDPGLSKAVAACDAPAMAAIDPMVARLVLGHRPGYSGDVFLVPQPGWINYGRTGTTHGSTFPHDTHVPALFLGAGVPHGETFSRTYIRDIAPTVAQIMGSPYPNGTTGQPISDLLNVGPR